jgi:hypothetical protein
MGMKISLKEPGNEYEIYNESPSYKNENSIETSRE